MRKVISVLLALMLLFGYSSPMSAAEKQALDAAVSAASAYILATVKNPEIGSIGGEWAVIGLARDDYAVPDDYYANYYKNVEKAVKEDEGVLHDVKYTEYSRVILGLTAAGFDPRDVAGYDLTEPLGDFDKTVWQGVNGPIFALIALDSGGYPIPENKTAKTQATRERYINEILRRQTSDGGWHLTAGSDGEVGDHEIGDADITGTALQALANYQDMPKVKAATEKALIFLSKTQDNAGGYSSGFSNESSAVESVVQVAIALCALGIPADDPRFVKNGNTVADNILNFGNSDGSFSHTRDSGGNNQMASEQAFCGLVALKRAAEGKSSLYSMSGEITQGNNESQDNAAAPAVIKPAGLPGKHADVKETPVTSPGATFADVKNHVNQTAIEALASRGIISGKAENIFDPDATMTRAEFAAIVTHALGLPEKTAAAFADVPSSAWYVNAIGTAYYYEIVRGVSATEFNPNGTITKQEAAVMTARAARLCGMAIARTETEIRDMLAQFGDYRTAAAWASEALAFCYSEHILDESDLDIQPLTAVKRCEVAEMLCRMLNVADLL